MAGIEEAFEKFSDRLAREESKRYSRDEQGDYVEEVQDPYPLKLGPLELGANANITTGRYSPDEYQNVSTMNRNVGLRGKYNVPDSGIALLGSIGDVRSSSKNKLNLPFNPMTGEAESYSETMRDVYKESPYSVGAQYNPKGTDQLFSALYNKGGGYNLGYNQGPVNVSYTSNKTKSGISSRRASSASRPDAATWTRIPSVSRFIRIMVVSRVSSSTSKMSLSRRSVIVGVL